eukprot:CAMPEP_0183391338 /NCGR_PEP_ID=MMETSP0370-20130417/6364_1 /TAXON_ID=268820 /ORGANISM="Peridinium aciculiferum, Strain PAER-2" /LENGTH=233 /DNA_ID=CAMNT_0025571041 /DNA_START=31 /DNA_END=729 /DNA_ORIENTATION=-
MPTRPHCLWPGFAPFQMVSSEDTRPKELPDWHLGSDVMELVGREENPPRDSNSERMEAAVPMREEVRLPSDWKLMPVPRRLELGVPPLNERSNNCSRSSNTPSSWGFRRRAVMVFPGFSGTSPRRSEPTRMPQGGTAATMGMDIVRKSAPPTGASVSDVFSFVEPSVPEPSVPAPTVARRPRCMVSSNLQKASCSMFSLSLHPPASRCMAAAERSDPHLQTVPGVGGKDAKEK